MTNPDDPRPSASLCVGAVVADRYRIDAVLGEGGMGIVYRAEHLHLRKPHALKVLLPQWSAMPEVMARFEREAIVAGQIASPHVVAATDFGRLPGGAFFLVMEYVDGRTLRTALAAGALDPARALHVLGGVVSALHAAHALGIVHRDLKPENIMLVDRDGDRDFVKVLDFGIAKVQGFGADATPGTSTALTQMGAVIGTAEYMSPEQAMGQPVDARSDLYSAGVVLFEMLTGRCPFAGSAITVLRQHVMADAPVLPAPVTASIDPRVDAILRRLLAKVPEDRFQSTGELMAALDACPAKHAHDSHPSSQRPWLGSFPGVTTLLRRSARGKLLVAALVVAAAAAITVLLAVGGKTRSATSTGTPPAATSAPSAVPTIPSPLPSVDSKQNVDVERVSNLPPPPAPSASTAPAGTQPGRSPPPRPPPPAGPSRRTGPGGIYIPPPSQWFK